jgi:O-antigen ligase
MSLHAIFVLTVLMVFGIGAFVRHPYYGLLGYVFLYFNIPDPRLNWWAMDLPEIRWSLFFAGLLAMAIFINNKMVSPLNFKTIPNFKFLALLSILMFFVSSYAVNPSASFSKAYDFFRFTIVFLFVYLCLVDIKKYNLFMWLCILCCMYLSYQAWAHPEYRVAGRLEGMGTPDSANSNHFAILLVTFVPYIVSIVLYGKWYEKCAALGGGVFVLNGIVLCGSRGAFLATCVMMIVFFLAESDKKVKIKLFFASIATAIIFIYLFDPSYIERTLSIFDETDTSGAGRTYIWAQGLQMAKDYPQGTGGLGFQSLSPYYITEEYLTRGNVRAAHNVYLLLLVEQSFAGLLLFLLFLWKSISMLRQLNKKIMHIPYQPGSNLQFIKYHSTATIASLSAIMVGSFFTERLYYEPLYFVAAIPCILEKYYQDNIREHELSGQKIID